MAPRASEGLLELFQEQTSFSHWCNARESGNEPIQHGTFVCAQIKPVSATAPKGTEIFPSAGGSCSPERPKTEKGNLVKSMTSPTFFLQNSWETVGSENHLSKPDVREIAKAYPRIPVGGHKSSGISQTAEVDVGCPAGEEPFTSYSETPSIHTGGGFYLLHRKTWRLIPPAASDTKRAWSRSLRLFQCVGDAKHELTPGSCWRQHNPPLTYQQLHHALMSPQNSVYQNLL
ncbi:LOW QUALITY PROTEIN: ciliary microtubule inner protein 6 [Cyanocitta cristata]